MFNFKLYFTNKKLAVIGALMLAIVGCGTAPTIGVSTGHELTVHRFITAFNRHDAEAMARLVTDNIEWLSVSGNTISAEASDKATLKSSMHRYFISCPTCQAKLDWIKSSNQRVSALEIASWQSDGVRKTQQSVSVYEFEHDKIRRVYYFAAESTEP